MSRGWSRSQIRLSDTAARVFTVVNLVSSGIIGIAFVVFLLNLPSSAPMLSRILVGVFLVIVLGGAVINQRLISRRQFTWWAALPNIDTAHVTVRPVGTGPK